MKIVVDVNLSPDWARLLTKHGHVAVHWSARGPANAPDHQIASWASRHDHAVLTGDLDFGAIATRFETRRVSVIQLRTGSTNPHTVGDLVLRAIEDGARDLEAGAVMTIARRRTRSRRLSSDKK